MILYSAVVAVETCTIMAINAAHADRLHSVVIQSSVQVHRLHSLSVQFSSPLWWQTHPHTPDLAAVVDGWRSQTWNSGIGVC